MSNLADKITRRNAMLASLSTALQDIHRTTTDQATKQKAEASLNELHEFLEKEKRMA